MQKKIQKEEPLEYIEEEIEVDKACYICLSDENEHELLICDKCNFKICHVECDEDILDSRIPSGDWLCHTCRK